MCSVFKKGGKYNPTNYKLINLTCVLSKVLEHIITSQMSFLEGHNLLDHRQHGIRNRHSCELQLIELTTEISGYLYNGNKVDACILNFSKAFDKGNRPKLINKLSQVEVSHQVSN